MLHTIRSNNLLKIMLKTLDNQVENVQKFVTVAIVSNTQTNLNSIHSVQDIAVIVSQVHVYPFVCNLQYMRT